MTLVLLFRVLFSADTCLAGVVRLIINVRMNTNIQSHLAKYNGMFPFTIIVLYCIMRSYTEGQLDHYHIGIPRVNPKSALNLG